MPHQQGNIIIQPITSICFQQSFPVTVHLKQEASALPTTSSSSLGPFIDPFSQYSIYHGGAAEKKNTDYAVIQQWQMGRQHNKENKSQTMDFP